MNDGRVWVELYDPKFIVMTEKYLTIPRLLIMLKKNTETWVYIQVEKIHNLRKSDEDCIESPDYSFTSCIEVKLKTH